MNTAVTHPQTSAPRLIGVTLLTWGTAVAVASFTGALRLLPPLAVAPLVLGGVAFATLCYFLVPAIHALFQQISLRSLTAFHTWRIAAAMVFFWYGSKGLLPALFVHRAAWGDLSVGLLAGAVALAWPTRGAFWLTHIAGLADLTLALATGIVLTRAPGAQMRHIVDLPVVLIPLFGVGITAAGHIIAFNRLARTREPQQA